VSFAAVVALAGCTARSAPAARAEDPRITRGQYLVKIMDCGGCHTPGSLAGRPDPDRVLGGSDIGFQFPGGIVYPPNLTPDATAGLGRWTDEEIMRAVKQGVGRDGRALVPIMPWPSYAVLTDDDARALIAYLRSIPPIGKRAPANVKAGEKPTAPYVTVVKP
jgi:mono/diheme cytochrome c family protein